MVSVRLWSICGFMDGGSWIYLEDSVATDHQSQDCVTMRGGLRCQLTSGIVTISVLVFCKCVLHVVQKTTDPEVTFHLKDGVSLPLPTVSSL